MKIEKHHILGLTIAVSGLIIFAILTPFGLELSETRQAVFSVSICIAVGSMMGLAALIFSGF